MKETAVEWLESRFIQTEGNIYAEDFTKAKEMEKQQKYSIDFIMWYSGMDKDKIENAHKRWINETFKSE